ncbi:cob(I)alamin adenosyltransferase [Tistlia consotensis]|uniref:Corrinoid adenosyltransferase n=1 Tax=Tistlia consotensis USBA 355 TaxID=560819 RepID=A0A1Y6BB49_9PROT|nr:cob(I)yrinic acid a,c-diamide adenosyltransferase [Tistlia consotensis]SME91543.1 cob(I)alamin adenosyltransferase [Tistlia consotensis USBA 355]SNR27423.1 cob(I)alamin adenosyltransferase [Tistlia consotensis]
MVQLTRIYTGGGDKGRTSLSSGKRVAKHDLRVEAYGTVDEANATLGLVRLHTGAPEDAELDALLGRIQNDLFDLGADLATPEVENPEYPPLRILAGQATWLEQQIDGYNAGLEPLKSFVLPGGSAAAAHLHLARTVVRRAERETTRLAERDAINPEVVRYLNRLSDLLFVLARHANGRGAADVLWVPGQHR